jgi:hypothetical protein
VTRRKIAVIVGDQNPFPGDLTGEQFAQIFRGEITNWSQVGGPNKPIRLIDRPTSDTRQALQPYPVFQAGPFQAGATAAPVNDDNVDTAISQLGDDGISYGLYDQVANKSGVKIVTLYGTPPTAASYPFSQALTYVYKQPASPAVLAFLGYATAPDAQQTVASVNTGSAGTGSKGIGAILDIFKPKPEAPAASPTDQAAAPTTAPTTAAPAPSPATDQGTNPGTVAQAPADDTAGNRSGLPGWLWLLAFPILGGLIWALLRGSDRPADRVVGGTAPVAGATGLVGGVDEDDSRIVLVPRNSEAAYAYWEVPESLLQRVRRDEGGQTLAVRLYDVTGQDIDRHPAHSIEQFECDESDRDLHIPIPRSDRDYLVELGYVTDQDRWFRVARSAAVHVPGTGSLSDSISSPISGAIGEPGSEPINELSSSATSNPTLPMLPTFPGLGESFKSGGTPLVEVRDLRHTEPAPPEPQPDLQPESASIVEEPPLTGTEATSDTTQRRVRRSQIVLVPRNSQDAYAYWEVLDHHKEIAKQHGGQSFILRICDVTNIDLDHQAPHSIQQFNCEETDTDRHITVPDSGEYVAEIGYLAKNGRWLRIARSAPVTIPMVDSRSTSLPFS